MKNRDTQYSIAMKKHLIIYSLLFVLVSLSTTSFAQLDPPKHKKRSKTEKSRLDKMETINRHTRKNKRGMTKAEIRRRKNLDRQARRRYKMFQRRKKSGGLTRAAKRMSRSEKRRRKSLRRKMKRID